MYMYIQCTACIKSLWLLLCCCFKSCYASNKLHCLDQAVMPLSTYFGCCYIAALKLCCFYMYMYMYKVVLPPSIHIASIHLYGHKSCFSFIGLVLYCHHKAIFLYQTTCSAVLPPYSILRGWIKRAPRSIFAM